MFKEIPSKLTQSLGCGVTYPFKDAPNYERQIHVKPLARELNVAEIVATLQSYFEERGYVYDRKISKFEQNSSMIFMRGNESSLGIIVEEWEIDTFEIFVDVKDRDLKDYDPPLQNSIRDQEKRSQKFSRKKFRP